MRIRDTTGPYDLSEPTRTLVPCWMPKPLPPKTKFTCWFAPAHALHPAPNVTLYLVTPGPLCYPVDPGLNNNHHLHKVLLGEFLVAPLTAATRVR